MGKITVDPRPGQRLREVRQHREISRPSSPRRSASGGTIQHYEHGRSRITDDRLDQLAQALQCARLELLMPPGSPPPSYWPRLKPHARRRQKPPGRRTALRLLADRAPRPA